MFNMQQLKEHKIVAKELEIIKNDAFRLIKQNLNKISERAVQDFILSEFKKRSLVSDKDRPIVAINQNSSVPHYFPSRKSRIIKRNNLVLVDLWARLKKKNSPFADITWIGYSGRNIPNHIQKTFEMVARARNIAIRFIRKELGNRNLLRAKDVDRVIRRHFKKFGIDKYFVHKSGHALGFYSCHGKSFAISKTSKKRLLTNIPFAIEPGLYFKDRYGIRSEINCYVNSYYRLIVTTKIQNKIIKLE